MSLLPIIFSPLQFFFFFKAYPKNKQIQVCLFSLPAVMEYNRKHWSQNRILIVTGCALVGNHQPADASPLLPEYEGVPPTPTALHTGMASPKFLSITMLSTPCHLSVNLSLPTLPGCVVAAVLAAALRLQLSPLLPLKIKNSLAASLMWSTSPSTHPSFPNLFSFTLPRLAYAQGAFPSQWADSNSPNSDLVIPLTSSSLPLLQTHTNTHTLTHDHNIMLFHGHFHFSCAAQNT